MDKLFKDVRKSNPREVDKERTIWVRVYGIPSHVWNHRFF